MPRSLQDYDSQSWSISKAADAYNLVVHITYEGNPSRLLLLHLKVHLDPTLVGWMIYLR